MKWIVPALRRFSGALASSFLVFVFIFTFHIVRAAGSTNSPEGLRQDAEEFVKLIETKNLDALRNRFSEQGTSFAGTSYVPSKASLSQQEINKDFETKTGAYCLFFDSDCLRSEDSKQRTLHNSRPLAVPLQSVAGLLAKAKAKRFVIYENLNNAKVTLLLSDRTPDTARLGEDALNFYFRFERGQWKLRNVEYN